MSKNFQISVLTANRLSDGAVIFLDHEGTWVDNIMSAAIAGSPDEARWLEARGAYDTARNVVVDAYLVEIRETDGHPVPLRFRERVRVGGPSILDDVPGYVPAAPPFPSPQLRGESEGEGQKFVEAA